VELRFQIPHAWKKANAKIHASSKLVCKADLIIWDEASMMHRRAFEVVDWTLRDLMQLDDAQATEKIFGGKTVVLGGDFRQILLVVPKGGQEDKIKGYSKTLRKGGGVL